jgi:hypothetical protein
VPSPAELRAALEDGPAAPAPAQAPTAPAPKTYFQKPQEPFLLGTPQMRDPENVRVLMTQVEVLRKAGKSDQEIRRMLGGRYAPEVFDTYLGPGR